MVDQENKNKIIIGIVVAAVIFMFIIGSIIAAVIIIIVTGDEEGADSARGAAEEFFRAAENGDTDKMGNLLMDPDGNFLKDSDPDELEDILMDMDVEEFGDLEWKIEDVEMTEWEAAETGPIYIVTFSVEFIDPFSGDTESMTETLMAAQNSESGKWGISLDGFEFEVTGDAYEDDNDPESATEIGPGKSEGHSLHVEEDEDWFKFTIDEGSDVTIWTEGSYGGDTEMYLYAEDDYLDELEYNDDRDDDMFSEIQITLDAGTYYIRVIPFNNDETVMDYTLEMDIN